jgi:hypothetical protein
MWRCPNRKTNIGSNGECPFQSLASYESRPVDWAVLRACIVSPPAVNKASCAPTLHQYRARIEGSSEGRHDPDTKRARYSRQGHQSESRIPERLKRWDRASTAPNKKAFVTVLAWSGFLLLRPEKTPSAVGGFFGPQKKREARETGGGIYFFSLNRQSHPIRN